jgi:hypothetical protein
MYQPYPSGGQESMPQRPPAPQSVLMAVRFMYAGAALSAIEIIIGLLTVGSLRSAIRTQFPAYTTHQIHRAEIAELVVIIVIGLLAVGLWLWMARANGAGRSWARIVATVLFALSTLDLLLVVARPHASIGLLLDLVVWLVGLGAIVFLWRKDSSAYFQAASQPPAGR